MNNWKQIRIVDCCEILDNKRVPLNSEERSLIQGAYPYCGANGIQDYIDSYIFDEDLILLAEDGGNFDEYQTRPIAYRVKGKSWVNNHAHVLKAKEGFCQDFIFYSLVNKNITPFIKGGTRSKLNLSELKEILLDVPIDPKEQKKIGLYLKTVYNQIEKTEGIISKYKAIKQGLMQDLFTRGIEVATGKLRPSYQQVPELYKPSPLGMIPKEWDPTILSKVATIVSGGTPSTAIDQYWKNGTIGWTTPSDITTNLEEAFLLDTQTKITELGLKNCSARLLPTNSLLMTSRATLGELKIAGKPLSTNQGFKSLIINSENHYLYYFYFMKFSKNRYASFGMGSTFLEVNKKDTENFQIIKPGFKEQELIANRLKSIDEKLRSERNFLTKTKEIKKGLMSDLLSGKVRVQVDEGAMC